MSLFGRKPRQLVKVLTEYGTVEDEVLDVERRYITNNKNMEAWGLDRLQQVKNAAGEFVQFVCEVSCVPVRLWGNGDKNEDKITKDNIDVIQSEAVDEELAFIDERKKKNRLVVFVGIIACMVFLVLAILIFQQVQKGGGISIPGM